MGVRQVGRREGEEQDDVSHRRWNWSQVYGPCGSLWRVPCRGGGSIRTSGGRRRPVTRWRHEGTALCGLGSAQHAPPGRTVYAPQRLAILCTGGVSRQDQSLLYSTTATSIFCEELSPQHTATHQGGEELACEDGGHREGTRAAKLADRGKRGGSGARGHERAAQAARAAH